RYRSPEKVIEEIEFLLNKYKVNQFEITDSIFNGSVSRVEKICDLIIEKRLDIVWSAKATLRKEMTYELLCKMKKSGCCALAYGVESGSPRVLRDMRKNLNLAEAEEVIKNTSRAGIQANCFFMIGYPTETEEDFELTLDFIRRNAPYIYRFDQVTGCHIEEDSYLGLNLEKYGIVFEPEGWCNAKSTPSIRRDRLQRFRDLARQLHKHYKCETQL
ncbi:MAG: radical SAM protein, partial [Candidatus Omnitrophica bacterium]|nr:radical SAM protein [Candidatus Omnitrophota bacterium]MBD3268976.1 radical SAM protein [Candidatus Omnitrophota bacterium]